MSERRHKHSRDKHTKKLKVEIDEQEHPVSDDMDDTQVAYRHELEKKTKELNKTQVKYDELQRKYEDLLEKVEIEEEKYQQTMDQSTEKDDDLVEWTKTCQSLLSMALKVIPYESKTPKSSADQRRILVDVVQQLCERAANPKNSKEYKELEHKYKKNKKRVERMREHCEELLTEVQNNRTRLETHIREVHERDQSALEEKVSQLEKMMKEQIKQQRKLDLRCEEDSNDSADLEESIKRADRLSMNENDSGEDLLVRSQITRKTAKQYTKPHKSHSLVHHGKYSCEEPRRTVTFTESLSRRNRDEDESSEEKPKKRHHKSHQCK